MKHFIIRIDYLVPLQKIEEIISDHREFLQEGYDKGILLFSGPMNPRTGGIVAARSGSMEEIQSFFQHDPYYINKAAEYNFTEFDPVKFQDVLKSWVS